MYAVKMFRSLLRNKQFVSSLIKRFQSTKPFNQCTNTCKCPNSAKINDIESLVLPTYFLTCGMGGYIIGNIIFTAISIIKRN
jgi:hypothetical protein